MRRFGFLAGFAAGFLTLAPAAADSGKAPEIRTLQPYPQLARPHERRSSGTACTLCAEQRCVTVTVRGRCTVDTAAAALRAGSRTEAHRRTSERLRHRQRSVSEDDYEELALEAFPEVRRAPRAAPRRDKATRDRLLKLYRTDRAALTARESDSLRRPKPSLRPLLRGSGSGDANDEDDRKH